ncbi:MAG: alpha/beta fold hydrolase [Ilumatobacteraceae bacterium]
MPVPVVLVHGWGGSFDSTWRRSGFTELLHDLGRPVIGVDLLGHGDAPKPHDPAAYADLGTRVVAAIEAEAGGGPVDAIGFSLGAITLLRLAVGDSSRFRRLVLAGIGRNVLEPDDGSGERIALAVEGHGSDDDTPALLFAQYASRPDNDPAALAAVMRRPRRPCTPDELARVTCPTLVVIGDADFAGPGDDLVTALGNARLAVLRRTDHFATPESFDFIDAALRFIDQD